MKYVIHSKSERGFWSNKQGWVYGIGQATKFDDDYVKMWGFPSSCPTLAKDAEWIVVKYDE